MQIIVVDDQKPEVVAMLQALYSRDPRSVTVHLEQVKARGADKFMSQFYVGYGHKSIGDCGTTTVFVENVSMLAAKAVQDSPLYNGQEASTRYLDMTSQEVLNPLATKAGEEVQEMWMNLYRRALIELVPLLSERFPGEGPIHAKAIKARAFDVARSLLPAGCTTYVAWHCNLRQAHDHLLELEGHPLSEVRYVGDAIRSALKAKYPSSFGHCIDAAQEAYVRKSMDVFAYWFEDVRSFSWNTAKFDSTNLSVSEHGLLEERPTKTELHQRFRQHGQIEFRFPLDFGSYRDLQRHRSSVQEMPLLTTRLGFHPWYLANLPAQIVEAIQVATGLMRETLKGTPPIVLQYYTPMGFQVPVKLNCTLPSAVYVAELRSGQTVHPTLRPVAQSIGQVLRGIFPFMAVHVDDSPDVWSDRRGMQDIVRK